MLKLLAMKEDAEEESSKDWTRLTTKIKYVFLVYEVIINTQNLSLYKHTECYDFNVRYSNKNCIQSGY